MSTTYDDQTNTHLVSFGQPSTFDNVASLPPVQRSKQVDKYPPWRWSKRRSGGSKNSDEDNLLNHFRLALGVIDCETSCHARLNDFLLTSYPTTSYLYLLAVMVVLKQHDAVWLIVPYTVYHMLFSYNYYQVLVVNMSAYMHTYHIILYIIHVSVVSGLNTVKVLQYLVHCTEHVVGGELRH